MHISNAQITLSSNFQPLVSSPISTPATLVGSAGLLTSNLLLTCLFKSTQMLALRPKFAGWRLVRTSDSFYQKTLGTYQFLDVANYNALVADTPDPITSGDPNYDEMLYINVREFASRLLSVM